MPDLVRVGDRRPAELHDDGFGYALGCGVHAGIVASSPLGAMNSRRRWDAQSDCCASRWTMLLTTSTPATARAIRTSADSQPRAMGGATSATTSTAAAAIAYVVRRFSRTGCAARRACAALSVSPTSDSHEHHDAEGDPHPGAVCQNLGEDAPRVVRGRLHGMPMTSWSTRKSTREAAYGISRSPTTTSPSASARSSRRRRPAPAR